MCYNSYFSGILQSNNNFVFRWKCNFWIIYAVHRLKSRRKPKIATFFIEWPPEIHILIFSFHFCDHNSDDDGLLTVFSLLVCLWRCITTISAIYILFTLNSTIKVRYRIIIFNNNNNNDLAICNINIWFLFLKSANKTWQEAEISLLQHHVSSPKETISPFHNVTMLFQLSGSELAF